MEKGDSEGTKRLGEQKLEWDWVLRTILESREGRCRKRVGGKAESNTWETDFRSVVLLLEVLKRRIDYISKEI